MQHVGPGVSWSHVQTLSWGSFAPGWSSRAGEQDGKVRMSQRFLGVFEEKEHMAPGLLLGVKNYYCCYIYIIIITIIIIINIITIAIIIVITIIINYY